MPTITIELPDTITLQLGRNAVYGTLDVEVAKLPPNALLYIWTYGLKQAVNDARSETTDKSKAGNGRDLTNEEIAAKCLKKLNALYDGTIRARGESVAADEYEAEAIRMAKRHIIATLSKQGQMKNIPKGTEDRMMFAVNRWLKGKGKDETTEAEYLAAYFDTPIGKVIKTQARDAVDARRALDTDLDALLPA